MTDAINTLFDFMNSFLEEINLHTFEFYGFKIGLIDVIVGFLFISFVVTIFWKGAKG